MLSGVCWSGRRTLARTTRHWPRSLSAIAHAELGPETVRLTWTDGDVSRFHHTWLRDHCPQSLHPVSNQRETQLRELELNALPESVSVGEQGQTLQIQWPAACEVSGGAHASTFASQWLRKYRYDSSSGYAAATARAWSNDEVEMWHPQELKEVPTVSWDALGGNSSDGGRAADEAALRCLRMLRRYGFVRVRGTPSTMEATQQLAEQLGALQPSFYGTLWDTAPREAGNVIDTAYSNVELPLHTDGSYQEHQPGLQLFNCVAQAVADDDPLAGCTKLADGFKAADVLRRDHPATYAYFTRVAVPFQHVEGDVHMRCTAPVFRLHPSGQTVVGVRYNETDRAPLDSLDFDDVGAFYTHVRVLESVFESLQMPLRLEVGDAVLIDNHRVLHGRFAFEGHRNLLGCYMTVDDWQSRLRVLGTAYSDAAQTATS